MLGDRWGVTAAETERRYPCDDLVPGAGFQAWRGVTVAAGAADVWPWIGQIRLAPYSYDWIDNFGRRSPGRLQGLPEPRAGETFTRAFGGRPAGRILAVTPGRELTGRIMGVVMSYVLVPVVAPATGPPATRLLLKLVAGSGGAAAALLSAGDLVMARRQLLNLARLAEQSAAAAGPLTN